MILPSTCYGTSEKFRIVDPQSPASIPPETQERFHQAEITNRKHCSATRYDPGNTPPDPQHCQFPEVPTGQGQVGSISFYHDYGGSIAANEYESSYTDFRSRMYFPHISNVSGKTLKTANLQIKVTMLKNNARPGSSAVEFCASSLFILAGPWNECMDTPKYVWDGGINVPYSQNTININVTAIVTGWLSGAYPNHGLLLTDFQVLPFSVTGQRLCWSYYTATLWMEFE
jgi:hypothetical protein